MDIRIAKNNGRQRFLDTAPDEAISPQMRITPLRKPDGFIPLVQRWSFVLPQGQKNLHVAFFGAQTRTEVALSEHPMHEWLAQALSAHVDGPVATDWARHTGADGIVNHVVCAYWVDGERYARWSGDAELQAWWDAPERLTGDFGSWRELLTVPRDRQESIYWRDYPAGLMSAEDVDVFPTPYCGYYGAMRDRIPVAAVDMLSADPDQPMRQHNNRTGFGERWLIEQPHNLAVIRSAHSWARLDDAQLHDYQVKLRPPVEEGMRFLSDNPLPTGCASMRWQMTTKPDGAQEQELHALGYFHSLRHMEEWAENHDTHSAIFNAALGHYRTYGKENKLRTWHEVYVLPKQGQVFEYINCSPDTGLLAKYPGTKL